MKTVDYYSKPLLFLIKHLLSIELLLILFSLAGLYLHERKASQGEMVMIVSLISLAVLYFLSGCKPFKNSSSYEVFYAKLTGLTLSATCIALLYMLLQWPGASMLLLVSLTAVIFNLFVFLSGVFIFKKLRSIEKSFVYRLILALIFLAILFFSPLNQHGGNSYKKKIDKAEKFRKISREALP
ncbi:MAG: hypothetical protein JXB34_12580 [Bacteroidales bacterium]|nr:hypothetical protein [Bacteroidales bacterium]